MREEGVFNDDFSFDFIGCNGRVDILEGGTFLLGFVDIEGSGEGGYVLVREESVLGGNWTFLKENN